jgi:hypothetical protein
LQQGLSLLGGRPTATGIVATIPLQGAATEVDLEGSILNVTGQLAFVAEGKFGLGIINASQFAKPLLLGQIGTMGTATDVAVDARLSIAAVATNEGGLQLVDVSDPTAPQLLRSIHVDAHQVEVFGGIAYVGADGDLRSYDLQTGEQLQRISLGSAPVTGMAREGETLYVMAGGTLRAITVQGTTMIARGSLSLPNLQGGGKLFAGGGIVYTANNAAGFFDPFSTIDASNPDHLTLITSQGGLGVAGNAVVANGSGLVLTTGNATGPEVDLFGVPNPHVRGSFLTKFNLPGTGSGIAIGSGIAFVAAGTGIEVVNYRAFDNLGQAPVVTISLSSNDVDPSAPGLQLFEGTSLAVNVTASDDVQVRNVELLVNGQVIQNSVSFPFNLSTILPKLADAPGGTVDLQVRATDTGGNSAVSNTIEVHLKQDMTAPALLDTSPADGAIRGLAFRSLMATFSEPIDPAGVNVSAFELLGPSGVVDPDDIQLRLDDRQVQFTYPALPPGSYQWVIHSTNVTDVAGNPLGANDVVRHFEVRAATISWANPLGGFWDDPANWDGGRVPGPNDDVSLDGANGAFIEYRTGSTEIRSLRVSSPMKLSGGMLIVDQTLELNSNLAMTGGTLQDAVVTTGGGGGRLVASGGTLAAVQLDADASVTYLGITGGLTLNGTITLNGNDPTFDNYMSFYGNETLFGSGQVVLGPNGLAYRNHIRIATEGGTLTIGPNITIRNVGVDTPYYFTFGNGTGSLINQGTIIADAAQQEVDAIVNVTVHNQGTLQVRNGSTLSFGGLTGDLGTATVADNGSRLLLSGQNFFNKGTLSAPVGTSLTLNGIWSNSGTINSQGGTLTFGGTYGLPNNFGTYTGTWTNAGAINVNGGTLNLGGSFTLANLGTLNRTGGTVNLTGTLDNTGTTLALNSTTGSWNLAGGTIKNGVIAPSTGGSQLLLTSGTLDGVTLNADWNLPASRTLTVSNGLTLNGILTIPSTATLQFNAGTQSLSGSGQVVMDNGSVILGGSFATTLTVASTMLIHGAGLILPISFPDYGFGTGILINQGTIRADVAGQSLSIYPTTLTNQGTLDATGSGSLSVSSFDNWTSSGTISANNSGLYFGATWSNTGTISANNSSVVLDGEFTLAGLGTWNRTGGDVFLMGTLDNTGTTLALDATTGSWNLAGGTIKNGTIAPGTGGAQLVFSDPFSSGIIGGVALDGVTLNSDLTVPQFATLLISNGLTLNSVLTVAASAELQFNSGTQMLAGSGQIALEADSSVILGGSFATTLTVASSMLIHGAGSISPIFFSGWGSGTGILINQGTIRADVAGQALILSPTTLTNQGTLDATSGGTLSVSSFAANVGTISAHTNSLVRINGSFTNSASGIVSVDIAGTNANQIGRVNSTGAATLDGMLNVTLSGAFVPAIGNTFQVITYPSHTGQFATINGGTVNYSPQYNASNVTLSVSGVSPLVQSPAEVSTVVARHLFYNQSGTSTRYDHNDLAINSLDDNAIATDKTAYLWEDPGAATFANVSSYTKGINGIMVDISGSHPSITAADFIFKVGNNNSPGTWSTANAPTSVSVRAGAGVSGSDRVEIIWNGAAAPIKQWLEVITLANANTGLAQEAGHPAGHGDAFFFGNAVGNTGLGDTTANSLVTATDEAAIRANPALVSANIPITNIYDVNRSASVSAVDESAARLNGTNPTTTLKYLNLTTAPAAPEAEVFAGDGDIAFAGDEEIASASGVASALTAPTTTSGGIKIPGWIANRLDSIDLNSGNPARLFQHLHDVNTPGSRKLLQKFDAVADALSLDDELLDSLLADLGLEK